MKIWFLEGLQGQRRTLQRIRVNRFPFQIGRQEGISLTLDSAGISRVHAQLEHNDDPDCLTLVDLNSTNGTFIDQVALDGQAPVRNGDIIHFGETEFRLVSETLEQEQYLQHTVKGISRLSQDLPAGAAELQELLLEGQVTALFQPILDRRTRQVHAYEILGRGTHPGLDSGPGPLFVLAESLDLATRLSELMRRTGTELAAAGNPRGRFFFNIHPDEIARPERLVAEMEMTRQDYPDLDIVMEIHESAITQSSTLEKLKVRLQELKVGLAYDDFGKGQARLMEIAEVPPDYVKLDMSLIRDIHRASAARQDMVMMICSYLRERKIRIIAEGVATESEARYMDRVGVDYLQGFHLGYPEPLAGDA